MKKIALIILLTMVLSSCSNPQTIPTTSNKPTSSSSNMPETELSKLSQTNITPPPVSDLKDESAQIIDLIKKYEESLPKAINANDFSLVETYLLEDSSLYESQKKLVANLYSQNIKEKLISHDVASIIFEGAGLYKVLVVESIAINYPQKGEEKREFHWIYTANKVGNSLKLSNIEAWKDFDKAQNSASSSGLVNRPILSIDKRVVKKSIANTYKHMIDYDLNFVQLAGTYKGIDAINEYYNKKEKEDFFGEVYNNWFNVPYPYNEHYILQANYRADVRYGNILSISGGGNSWAGGVNNPTIYSDVFDLNTGKKLTLSDIFKVSKDEYLKLIYEEVSKSVNKEIAGGQNRYNFKDAYSTDGKTAIAKFQTENFYLTGKSLVVYYPKYSLGIGAAGVFIFEIPLDLIKDKLKIDISERQLF